jgi:hypothetical protein
VLLKVGDPAERLTPLPPGSTLRVLLPEGEEFQPALDTFASAGAEVRRVRYLLEEEAISVPGDPAGEGSRSSDGPTAVSRLCRLNQPYQPARTTVTGSAASAAQDAFDLMWKHHAPDAGPASATVPAESIVPPQLARYLP